MELTTYLKKTERNNMNFKDAYIIKVAKVIKVIGDKTYTFKDRAALENATRSTEHADILNSISGGKHKAAAPLAVRDVQHSAAPIHMPTAHVPTPLTDAAKTQTAAAGKLKGIGAHIGKHWPAYAVAGAGIAGLGYLGTRKKKDAAA